ncbi:hypothetical protein Dsin_021773 [Dipteronia sinensis]|uniref:Bet v I/Major latex protein domain-containing protein n=1 Tax=Dipteronia sinensis TaxID=43782 RepID=A0AAE0A069_9ROSI|nr:hypothetical protein Dsin_021773 [Dipteronia sinensis]
MSSSSGKLCHELEVDVGASEVWELYGTLKLAKLVEQQLTSFFHKIEVLQGDGGVGTLLNIVLVPGTFGYKERFTKVDNERRIKETEIVEGGYLELGFIFYIIRLEIIENLEKESSSIIKTTIEYQLMEDMASNASIVTIQPLAHIAQTAKTYLLNLKHNPQ